MTDASWSAYVLVIFGITGDLAHRMTIPTLYELAQRGRLDCPIVGVATTASTIRCTDHAFDGPECAVAPPPTSC